MKKPSEIFVVPAILVLCILAIIAIPSFLKARRVAQTNACLNALRMIYSCESSTALGDKIAVGDPISEDRVNSYLPQGDQIRCPSGGTISRSPIFGPPPTCSIHGDLLREAGELESDRQLKPNNTHEGIAEELGKPSV